MQFNIMRRSQSNAIRFLHHLYKYNQLREGERRNRLVEKDKTTKNNNNKIIVIIIIIKIYIIYYPGVYSVSGELFHLRRLISR